MSQTCISESDIVYFNGNYLVDRHNIFSRKCDAMAFLILKYYLRRDIQSNYEYGDIKLAGYDSVTKVGVFCGYPIMIDDITVICINPKMRFNTMKNKIITDFPVSKINTRNPDSWYCLVCFEDLGENNPRQYCCKTYCPWQI